MHQLKIILVALLFVSNAYSAVCYTAESYAIETPKLKSLISGKESILKEQINTINEIMAEKKSLEDKQAYLLDKLILVKMQILKIKHKNNHSLQNINLNRDISGNATFINK